MKSIKKIINKSLHFFGYQFINTKNRLINQNNPFFDQTTFFDKNAHIVIFDIGAHLGQTTLSYKKFFKHSTVYAFEPHEESFEKMSKGLDGKSNIYLFNIALGESKIKMQYKINRNTATNSFLEIDDSAKEIWGASVGIETEKIRNMELNTLDDFVKEEQVNQIDILKIDTQGTEFNIIKGASTLMKENRIKLIYIEIILMPTYKDQKSFDEILSLMRESNFHLFKFYDLSYTRTGQLRQVDAIFICEDLNNMIANKLKMI